jgi:hypothetical protein
MTAEPNDYLPPQQWGVPKKLRVGHIAVKCVGGYMDGEFVDVGVGATFFRALSGAPLTREDRGYLPDRQVHSYRLIKQQHHPWETVFALETLLILLPRRME